jgi:hypothetical protein
MDFAKTARNLGLIEIALAFARDRLAGRVPGVQPRKRRPGLKTVLIGGGFAATAAALLFKRDKVLGLLPGRPEDVSTPAPSGYTPPPVSNYDAPGPVANTATSVPVPPPYESETIDEAAEEAAAAAEAANIGGQVSDYAGSEPGEVATPEERPLAEAGEGESEGGEQIDADLEDPESPPPSAEEGEWRTWSGRSVDS